MELKSNISHSFDTSLGSLIQHVEGQLAEIRSISDDSSCQIERLPHIDLEIYLEQLRKQLEYDNLVNEHTINTIENLKTLFSQTMNESNLNEISDELLYLARKVRPLDLEMMFDLFVKAKQCAEQISNKDVILLLGGTGVGKSTTIQFLGGSEMVREEMCGVPHIAVKRLKYEVLSTFITSPLMSSETKTINAAEVSLEECGASTTGWITLCDTPGFGDTAGAEVDIANSIGIAHAMRLCRSIKPLIVIGYRSIGERLEGLMKLSDLLVKLFGSIELNLPSFTYIFTKFPKDDVFYISNQITLKLRALNSNDKANKAFVALINDIIKKTKNGAFILDPVIDDPGKYLDHLISVPSMERTFADINNFVTTESLHTLLSQLQLHSSSISHALNRMDMDVVSYKLQQVVHVKEALKISDCNGIVDECLSNVIHWGNSLLDTFTNHLKHIFDDETMDTEEDIKHMCNVYLALIKFDMLRSSMMEYLGCTSATEKYASLQLLKHVFDLHTRFIGSFKNSTFIHSNSNTSSSPSAITSLSTSLKNSYTFNRTVAMLNKLSIIYEEFISISNMTNKEFLEIYFSNCWKHTKSEWNLACEIAVIDAKNINIASFFNHINFIKSIEESCNQFLSVEDDNGNNNVDSNNGNNDLLFTSDELMDLFIENVHKNHDTVQSILNQSCITSTDSNVIFTFLGKISPTIYQSITITVTIYMTVIQDLEILYNTLKNDICNLFIRITDHIKNIFATDSFLSDYISVCNGLISLSSLIISDEIKLKCIEKYSNLILFIKWYFNNISERLLYFINAVFNGMSGSRIIYENLDEINHMVRVLQQAQECFISNDFNNIYNGEFNNIVNSFMSHLNIFSNEITNLRLSITGHIHLFPILQTLKCISAFSAMINIHCNHIIRSILVDIIIKELNEVRTLIQDKTIEEIDVNYIRNIFSFFYICQWHFQKEYEIHSSKTSNSTSSVEVDAEENKEETMNEEKKSDSNGNGNGMKSFKSSIYDCINYDGNTNNATVSYTTSHSIGNLLDDINQAVVTAIDLFSQRTSQSLLNTWNIICGCNGNNQDATTTADTLRDIFHTTSRYLHLLSTLEHIYCNEASFPVRNAPLYEELFHIIPHRLLSEWCAADNGKLVHIQRQLLADKEEAVNTSDMKRLCELMNQIQYLVLLDPFLPKTCTPNFMMLQDMIVTAIRGCMSSLCTRIRGSIASHNWDDVAVFLKKFDANYSDSINDFNELCSCICTELEGMWTGLSDNIKNMNSQSHTQCLSRETFLSMHSLLGSMYDAATHVFIFLTPEQTNVLSENISNIKQRLQSVVIRRLITAIDHITLPKEDFEKAVECIPQILSVADTFKNMSISANLIAKYPQFSYNQSNFDDFIRYQCNALVEDIRTKIRMIISSYEKTDKPLVTIIQQGQPKLFLNSLKSMSKMNSQFQQDITALLAVLKKTVEGMTKNVLEQKGNEVSISISHGEHVVRDLEMLFPYLPDEIQGDVGASIRACEILINEAKQKEEEECRFLDQSGEFHKLIELYLKSIENRDYYKIDKYRTDVQKTIRAENIKIKDFLNKNKIENALKFFADKYDNWFYYINNLKSILHKVNNSKRIYTWTILSPWNYYQAVEKLKPDIDMEQLCLETERNMRTYTCNVLDHMNKLSITDCQAINKLDYRFNDFIAISNIFENSEPFRSFLTSKCNNVHPLQCIKIISQIFTCYKTHVEKALCSGDATILATILSTIKDLDNTVAEAKRYESSYHTCLHCPDLHTALENFPTFDGIRCDFSKVILHLKDELLTKFDQNPRAKSKNAYDRDEFYKYYSNSFKKLLSMRPIAIYYSSEIINMNTLEDNFRRHIYDQFVSIEETLEVAMKLFPFDNNNDQVARDICIYIDNFRSIEENFDDDRIQNEATARRVKCINAFQQAIQKYYNSVLCAHMDDNNSIVTNLINLKKVGINISIFKTTIDDTIDTFLQEIKRIKGMKTIGLIGVSLNNQISNKTTAQMLINETRALQGYSIALRNEKTLRMTYKDILKDIECDHDSSSTLDRNVLECHYKAFDEEYWRLVELGINDIKTVQDIPNKMYSNLSSLRTTQERCLHILIYVFSYWTLENYRSRRLDKDSEKLKSIGSNNSTITTSTTTTIRDQFDLLRPHAAQVLACFLLLGIEHHDSNTTTNTMSSSLSSLSSSWHLFSSPSPRNVFAFAASLKRQLVQILTGEGKSLILSVTAIVLAVMGCNVNCACYSHYLSQRDFEAYSHLFNAFSVKQFISYGTFHSLCESMINRNGNIRHMVRNVITNSTSTNNSDCPNGSRSSGSVNDVINSIMKTEVDLTRPNILLIDEVDVFFSSDFYGNLYKPVTTIQDPIITNIILYIWNNNSINNSRNLKTGIRFDDVRKTSEYAAIISKYSHWKDLIENSIRMMLFDLKTFDAHEYVVQDDKIGYKDQDNISFNISYGYKTMFAYLKECLEVKPPRISRATMNSKLSLSIGCGVFSYAEIPKEYDGLMGVTGTLKTLSTPEKDLLKTSYNTSRHAYIPSVYGKNQMIFAKDSPSDCLIESSASFYAAIVNEISHRMRREQGTTTSTATSTTTSNNSWQRAVLIFFESTTKLISFYNSSEFDSLRDDASIMTEQTSSADKEGIVRRAVTAGSITLLTRIFGRGTDFICYDDNLIQNGGVHVIQTFVSIQLSEETQIMGRTARQGNKGSFSLILLDEELEKFGIQNIDIDRMRATGSYYTAIDKARCEYFHKEYPENMRYVDTIKGDHENSLKFIHSLLTNDIHQISSYLVDKNEASIDTNETFRTVCLMDATGSMSQLLQKCKNTVQTMFERLETVLQAKNRKANIEMQYVMYRNYSSGTDKLLEFSSWESDPMNLRMFMDSIGVSGGQGNEAIEVALHHACVEDDNQKIHQIILIGDRPPNTDEEIIEKRSFCGEEYWSRTKFATPTNARSEVIKIRNKNIPIHAFYVEQYAQISFEKISSATGGRCEELQIHSDRGSEQLIDLMSEEVLRTVGGKELVDEYQKMYKKGFTD